MTAKASGSPIIVVRGALALPSDTPISEFPLKDLKLPPHPNLVPIINSPMVLSAETALSIVLQSTPGINPNTTIPINY